MSDNEQVSRKRAIEAMEEIKAFAEIWLRELPPTTDRHAGAVLLEDFDEMVTEVRACLVAYVHECASLAELSKRSGGAR